jgi:hypothetical protein
MDKQNISVRHSSTTDKAKPKAAEIDADYDKNTGITTRASHRRNKAGEGGWTIL